MQAAVKRRRASAKGPPEHQKAINAKKASDPRRGADPADDGDFIHKD